MRIVMFDPIRWGQGSEVRICLMLVRLPKASTPRAVGLFLLWKENVVRTEALNLFVFGVRHGGLSTAFGVRPAPVVASCDSIILTGTLEVPVPDSSPRMLMKSDSVGLPAVFPLALILC